VSDSFERLFPRRALFRGHALAAVLWSALASISLVLTLFIIFLVATLLETGGRLVIDGTDANPETSPNALAAERVQQLESLVGPRRLPKPIVTSGPGGPRYEYDRAGILSSVWRSRDRWWGGLLARMDRDVPALRTNRSALVTLVLLGVLIGVGRSSLVTIARRQATETGLDVGTFLRRAIHRQRLRLGPSDLSDSDHEPVARLFHEDVNTVGAGAADWVTRVGRYPFELALLLLLALSIHWRVTIQCLVPIAFGWYVLQQQRHRTRQNRRHAEARSEEELRLLSESLQKTRLIRGYGMEDFESEQFAKNLQRYRAGLSGVERGDRSARWLSRLIVLVTASVVLVLMGLKILQPPGEAEGLTLAGALVLMTVFAWMFRPVEELFQARRDRAEVSVIVSRIYRYLDRIPEVGQAVGAKFLQPLSKGIEFEDVTYSQPNRKGILDGVSVKLPAGGSIALVSLDPLEPRAMAYMLPRFVEPQSGRVLFDGQDIAWVTLESLRAETIYVGGADPFLTATVRENITGGRPEFSLQDVTAAAKQAHASKFILDLPQGYETMIGEHGEQLDAGQSFRLGLARGILRDPALLIIEEPTEPLDEDTKSLLDDAYNRILRGRTVVFVPWRLSTIKRCDLVVLLHEGKVEAVGPHSELVRTNVLYRHWEYVRFNTVGRQGAPVPV
jgi:ABC-type multidrug transport system fused ATPase/permease subunit